MAQERLVLLSSCALVQWGGVGYGAGEGVDGVGGRYGMDEVRGRSVAWIRGLFDW